MSQKRNNQTVSQSERRRQRTKQYPGWAWALFSSEWALDELHWKPWRCSGLWFSVQFAISAGIVCGGSASDWMEWNASSHRWPSFQIPDFVKPGSRLPPGNKTCFCLSGQWTDLASHHACHTSWNALLRDHPSSITSLPQNITSTPSLIRKAPPSIDQVSLTSCGWLGPAWVLLPSTM